MSKNKKRFRQIVPVKKEEVRPEYKLRKKPTVLIKGEIFDAIFDLAKTRNLEWTIYAHTREIEPGLIYVDDYIVPNQLNSVGETEIVVDDEKDDMAEWQTRVMMEKDDKDLAEWNCWIHSHHTMGAFWSQTDDENKALMADERKENGKPFICIVVSEKNEGEYLCSVCYPHLNMELNASIVRQKIKHDIGDISAEVKSIKDRFLEEKIDTEGVKKELSELFTKANSYIFAPGISSIIDKEIDEREETYRKTYKQKDYGYYGSDENEYSVTDTPDDARLTGLKDASKEDQCLSVIQTDKHFKEAGKKNEKSFPVAKESNRPGYYVCNSLFEILSSDFNNNYPKRIWDTTTQTGKEGIDDAIKKGRLVAYFDSFYRPLWIYCSEDIKKQLKEKNSYLFSDASQPEYLDCLNVLFPEEQYA